MQYISKNFHLSKLPKIYSYFCVFYQIAIHTCILPSKKGERVAVPLILQAFQIMNFLFVKISPLTNLKLTELDLTDRNARQL